MLLSLPCCIRKPGKAHALANRRESDRIGLRCWRHGRHSRAFTRDILRRRQRTAPNPRYYETLRLPMAPLGVVRCSLSFPNTLWRSSGFVSRVLSHTARVRGTSLLPAWDCSQFQGFGLTLARRKGRLYYLYPTRIPLPPQRRMRCASRPGTLHVRQTPCMPRCVGGTLIMTVSRCHAPAEDTAQNSEDIVWNRHEGRSLI